jgi:ribosomal protein L35AE/L33A
MKITLLNVLSYIAFEANDTELKKIEKELIRRKETKMYELSNTLRVGTIAFFKSKKQGKLIEGRITKVNKKTAKLDCGVDGDWKVTLSLLEIKK